MKRNLASALERGATQGGVTAETESERAWGAILTHHKDDETVEGILVLGKTFSFAGGAGMSTLATSKSQPPLALKRSGGGRRGGRDSKSFAAAGW